MSVPRFFKDIERCPYILFELGYDQWNKNDQKRLKEIDEYHEKLLDQALKYISNEDRNIKEMAHFVIGMLETK